jgi:hypothetical protein
MPRTITINVTPTEPARFKGGGQSRRYEFRLQSTGALICVAALTDRPAQALLDQGIAAGDDQLVFVMGNGAFESGPAQAIASLAQ